MRFKSNVEAQVSGPPNLLSLKTPPPEVGHRNSFSGGRFFLISSNNGKIPNRPLNKEHPKSEIKNILLFYLHMCGKNLSFILQMIFNMTLFQSNFHISYQFDYLAITHKSVLNRQFQQCFGLIRPFRKKQKMSAMP